MGVSATYLILGPAARRHKLQKKGPATVARGSDEAGRKNFNAVES